MEQRLLMTSTSPQGKMVINNLSSHLVLRDFKCILFIQLSPLLQTSNLEDMVNDYIMHQLSISLHFIMI